jgi:iron complex transport system substrate-binding protein
VAEGDGERIAVVPGCGFDGGAEVCEQLDVCEGRVAGAAERGEHAALEVEERVAGDAGVGKLQGFGIGDGDLAGPAGAAGGAGDGGWQAESTIPLKPDLVLVGSWDRSLTQRLLRALGFRVVKVDVVAGLAAARAQIREIAVLLGHPQRGEALIAEIDAAQRRLAQARRGAATTALLVGNGGYTVGPSSLAAALMNEAGLTAPPGAPAGYGGFVPLEKLIELPPDVLVVSNLLEIPDGQGAIYLTHPALQELYPTSRRILLPSRYTLCGGPSLIAAFDYLTEVVIRLNHKP